MFSWDKGFDFGWLAILGILAAYELFAVFYGYKHGYVPLTWVVTRWVPWFITMPFLTWLWVHFFTRYLHRAAYLKEMAAYR